jgi:hypothetical protein
LSYTSEQIDSQNYTYQPSLFETVQNRNIATQKFREKWGGVISPSYTEGANLSSNNFVGTATTQDVIETLINPETSNRYVGSSSNLATYLRERNWTPETAPDNWTAPEKQLVLREQLAGLSQSLVQPPEIKTPRPNPRSPTISTRPQETDQVVLEIPKTEMITSEIETPRYALSNSQQSTIDPASVSPSSMALPSVALLIGAGVAIGVIVKKMRGKK